ncbi:MAG: MBL fold metallo-hydrolase [Candidatus Neomarinimicrobiota bacterium]
MSEPKARADRIQPLTPWLYHWTVPDDRIDNYRSDAYAVLTPEGLILIDPLPLTDKAQATLENVAAIYLTGGQHQRSAWRYRNALGVPVYAPEGAAELEEEPDQWYRDGDSLPGGFTTIQIHGMGSSFALLMETEGGSGALFCGDLLIRASNEPFQLLPDRFMDDPARVRESAEKLAQIQIEILCSAHGEPCVTGCGKAIREALEKRKASK